MSEAPRLPDFNPQQAAELASRLYGIEGSIRQLNGERDLNFLIEGGRERFVFKIANADEAPEMLACQHQVFERLANARALPDIACAITSLAGRDIEYVTSSGGVSHACRVLPFVDGRMMDDCGQLSPELLQDLGACLARLDLALDGFSHTALNRPLLWEMRDAPKRIAEFKPMLRDEARIKLVSGFESGFHQRVLPVADKLRRAVIHNDANRGNVLVSEDGQRVVSIIDFGDMVESWLVIEPAVAATYAMLGQSDPLQQACHLVAGFHRVLPLESNEIDILFDLIGMRLCMSVCIGAYQHRLQPDNDYLLIDQQDTWQLLEIMSHLDRAAAREAFQNACAGGSRITASTAAPAG